MLNHMGTTVLYTKRLILRKFTIDDAENMFHTWANDKKVTHFLTWNAHESIDFTKQLLGKWVEAYKDSKTYNWAIQFEGKVIGNISVVRLDDQSEHVDLGYCLGYKYWNCGFMTESTTAVIDYLFSEIGVNRIGISHATENPSSGKVAQKCGMTYEGTKREYFKTATGKFVDIAGYSILKKEWKKTFDFSNSSQLK